MKNICLLNRPHIERIVINGIEYINSAFIKLVTTDERANDKAQKQTNILQFNTQKKKRL